MFLHIANNKDIDWKYFKDELCKAYNNENDEQFMFYPVLSNKLHHSLQKRDQFYHILMHHYLRLNDLNQQNVIHILFNIMHEYNEHITTDNIQRIVNGKNMDGKTLKKLAHEQNGNALKEIFNKLHINSWNEILSVIKYWKLNVSKLSKDALPDKLIDCNTNDLIIIAYIVAININKESKESMEVISASEITKLFDDDQLNGNKLMNMREDEERKCIEKADKTYKLSSEQITKILRGIKTYFEQNIDVNEDDEQKQENSKGCHESFDMIDSEKEESIYQLPAARKLNLTKSESTESIIDEKEREIASKEHIDEHKMDNNHSKLGNIKDCCKRQMMNAINDICDSSDKEKLRQSKQFIMSYIEHNNIDGQQFANMKRKEFGEAIVRHCDDNQ